MHLLLAKRPARPMKSCREGLGTNVARANPGAGLRGCPEGRAGD